MLTSFLQRLRPADRRDEGAALIVSLALVGLATALMTTMITVAVSDNRATGRDRARSAAVTTAEGAVDRALSTIQEASVASVPCTGAGAPTSEDVEVGPDSLVIQTEVVYYDAAGTVAGCPLSPGFVATRALIRGTSIAAPAGGGTSTTRSVESLVQLKPLFDNDLNKAIFGNAGVVASNNFDLYGQNGPDADVYTNGNFSCANNQHYRGSVYAQGTISMTGTCTIDVNAHAGQGFTGSRGQVQGDVIVGNGRTATMTGAAVAGKVRASVVSPAAYCTSNAGKCVLQPQAAPPAQAFPQLKADPATLATWTAQGFATKVANSCGAKNDSDPAWWLENRASTAGKTLLRTSCRLSFPTNTKTVRLGADVAVFADGGVDLSQSMTFESTSSSQVRNLYLIQPFGSTCSTSVPGISLSQQVTMAASVQELLYSPCNVDKANQTTLYGQVYAGGTATISNKTDAYYRPLPVFGITGSNTVKSYTSDVLYKREVVETP